MEDCALHPRPPQDSDQLAQLRRVDGAAPVHVKLGEGGAVGGDLLLRVSGLKCKICDYYFLTGIVTCHVGTSSPNKYLNMVTHLDYSNLFNLLSPSPSSSWRRGPRWAPPWPSCGGTSARSWRSLGASWKLYNFMLAIRSEL